MKKIISFLFLIAVIATSCTEKNTYTIKGTLPDETYEGNLIFLQALDAAWSEDLITIDSTKVTNGQFEFKGVAKDNPGIYYIAVDQPPFFLSRRVIVIPEAGIINVKLDTISTATGTPTNDAFQAYMDKGTAINTELKALHKTLLKEPENAEISIDFEKKVEESKILQSKELYAFVKPNVESEIGTFLLLMTGASAFSLEQMNELFPLIRPEYQEMDIYKSFKKNLSALNATAVGRPLVNLKGKTPEDKEIELLDYAGKGKTTLIFFWVSWSNDCIDDMFRIKDLYAKYKDKGFEVFVVSADDEAEEWLSGTKKRDITFPQISDLQGEKSPLLAAYGIYDIPYSILLDKDGFIVARGQKLKEIESKIGELLK